MSRFIKHAVKTGLRSFGGYEVIQPDSYVDQRHTNLRYLVELMSERSIYSAREWDFLLFCARNLDNARSQCFQDLFVLFELEQKTNGFFVEFGAADGKTLSNSYLLEADYGWSGILSEPARVWREQLQANRKATVDPRCVWSESGKTLDFHEHPIAVLSALKEFRADESDVDARNGAQYQVPTVSLNDLLSQNGAPDRIDYLSIDTEGSEFAILSHFDFTRHDIKVITVEHNFVAENRQNIHDLLVGHGYIRVLERVSAWDDWFVRGETR